MSTKFRKKILPVRDRATAYRSDQMKEASCQKCAFPVSGPDAPLEIIGREIPQPSVGTIRIKVQACGICHSDTLAKEGNFPLVTYPRVPGHEIVGLVEAVGPGVVR